MSRTGSSHPCIRSATETLNSCTFRTRTTYKSCILGLEPCIILPNIEQNRVRSSMAQVAITVAPAVYAALPSSTNILYNTPSSRDTNKARDIWQKATPAYPENPASFSSPPGALHPCKTPYSDGVPLVVFCGGQIPTSTIDSDAFQKADVVGISGSRTENGTSCMGPPTQNQRIQAFIDLPKDLTVGILKTPLSRGKPLRRASTSVVPVTHWPC